MAEKWYFVENGKRPNEKIIATYTPKGNIHTVASAFPDKAGYIYSTYPVSYNSHKTIDKPGKLSIHEIDFRGYKK